MITIRGRHFVPGARVLLGQGTGPVAGAIPATSVDVISPMKIIATTGGPAKPGVFNVFVVTTGGPSIATVVDRYRYEQAPSVAGVHPNHGPSAGGNTVTIRGSHFTPDATVSFGATAATHVTYVSTGDLTVTASAGSGTVAVTVTTPGGTSSISSSDQYTYT